MTSGDETPGLGYPGLKAPKSRVPQAYRSVWFTLLELVPRNLRTVQQARRGLRTVARNRR